MDEPPKPAKGDKLVTEEQVLYDSTYMRYTFEFMQAENKMTVARDSGEEKGKSFYGAQSFNLER